MGKFISIGGINLLKSNIKQFGISSVQLKIPKKSEPEKESEPEKDLKGWERALDVVALGVVVLCACLFGGSGDSNSEPKPPETPPETENRKVRYLYVTTFQHDNYRFVNERDKKYIEASQKGFTGLSGYVKDIYAEQEKLKRDL